MSTGWTLEAGLEVDRYLEFFLAPNYHAGLFGSVLHRGHSQKDLDIIVFPNNSNRWDIGEIRYLLETAGLTLAQNHLDKQTEWVDRGITDTKCLEVWRTADGRRVDVLLMVP